jgi:hypothetical protein
VTIACHPVQAEIICHWAENSQGGHAIVQKTPINPKSLTSIIKGARLNKTLPQDKYNQTWQSSIIFLVQYPKDLALNLSRKALNVQK